MAEPAATETHVVVEIPVDSSETDTANQSVMAHPLSEISESPGHLLLLKLYQREEDQLSRRVRRAESSLDAAKRDAFRLSSIFFSFHALFLTLLFAASVSDTDDNVACRSWWLPASLSALASCAMIASLQVRVCEYWRVLGRLQRDRGDARALARCVRELRMKGASFDLSREPLHGGKRAKSSSVEVEWRPLRWLSRNRVTICLICVAGLLVPACKFMICS